MYFALKQVRQQFEYESCFYTVKRDLDILRLDLVNRSFGSGSDRVRSVRVMFGLANFGFGSGAVRVEFGSGPVRVD